MSRKYKFHNPKYAHFVSFATIDWIDLFTRRTYFEVVTDSFSHCINHKGLILNAGCIMTNHVHLIIRSETNKLQNIMRDMKKFTSKELISEIQHRSQKSRKERLLSTFEDAGRSNSNNTYFQLWQQHNHPIELSTYKMVDERLNYLHMNPVKAGFGARPENWLYSSAKNYAGVGGMLDLELIK